MDRASDGEGGPAAIFFDRRGGCYRRPLLLIGVSRRPEEVRHGVLTLSFVFKMVAPSSLLGRLSKVPVPVAFA